jgi:hypothetical protein
LASAKFFIWSQGRGDLVILNFEIFVSPVLRTFNGAGVVGLLCKIHISIDDLLNLKKKLRNQIPAAANLLDEYHSVCA